MKAKYFKFINNLNYPQKKLMKWRRLNDLIFKSDESF